MYYQLYTLLNINIHILGLDIELNRTLQVQIN